MIHQYYAHQVMFSKSNLPFFSLLQMSACEQVTTNFKLLLEEWEELKRTLEVSSHRTLQAATLFEFIFCIVHIVIH